MNVKAEKIEQIIQIVNRNLLLIFAGQRMGIVPLDVKNLEKVDAGVFGNDKFAFEMIHFVKADSDSLSPETSVAYKWGNCFVKGLETLLVECAVVKDDIERDCFISRVYCWFTERLGDRRDLPRPSADDYDGVMDSSKSKGNDSGYANTVKALEASMQKKENENQGYKVPDNVEDEEGKNLACDNKKTRKVRYQPSHPGADLHAMSRSDHSFQPVASPSNISPYSFLPKLPGAEDVSDMGSYEPETEAEKNMQDMWLAKRRQEAFDWKTQQHLSMVMDRMGLHKSRLEAESLRRQESGSFLSQTMLSKSGENLNTVQESKSVPKFAPLMNGSRPLSGKRDNLIAANELVDIHGTRPPTLEALQAMDKRNSAPPSPKFSKEQVAEQNQARRQSRARTSSRSKDPEGNDYSVKEGRPSLVAANTASAAKTDLSVKKSGLQKLAAKKTKKEFIPMRFKGESDPVRQSHIDTQHYYMELSDNEDSDEDKKKVVTKPNASSSAGNSRKAPNPPVRVKPVNRARPIAAAMFKDISQSDNEFKVHYRHTNYRRMPVTNDQEKMLDLLESERAKKYDEYVKELTLAAALAKSNKGDKKAPKDAKAKKKKAEEEAKKKEIADKKQLEINKAKYKTAAQFMAKNFPTFDSPDPVIANANAKEMSTVKVTKALSRAASMSAINVDQTMGGFIRPTDGPMRTMHLVECNRILDVCDQYDVNISQETLHRALLIPQDRSEAQCLEGQRFSEMECLSRNPLPQEYWRVSVEAGKKKKRRK